MLMVGAFPASENETMLATSAPPRSIESREAVRLEGRDILCFSHDWNGDPLSKTHLMRLLARNNRVLWVNSIGYRAPTASRADLGRAFKKLAAATTPLRTVEPNLHVLSPLAIPAYGLGAIRRLNTALLKTQIRWAMRRLGFRKPLNWTFNPAAALVAGALGEDALIYYCVDEYTAFSGVPTEALIKMEEQLLRKADAVIVSAERLYRSKAPLNPRIALVRHGVDFDHFRKACSARTQIPDEIASLPKPIIGYFGLIGRDWVDVPLLEHVARRFAHGSLVMLGKVTMDVSALARLPNVHLLGRKPYEDLPAYCKGFDCALIPFPVSEVTLNANPLKAREYLAAGLPVVSTPIPEVEVLGQCRIGATPEQFASQIEDALRSPGPSLERSDSMRAHSWQARLDEVLGHLARLVPERRSGRTRALARAN
jgi:glycosyltransferase involved in cell wall biosynthesis